jgi:hypothetical protein
MSFESLLARQNSLRPTPEEEYSHASEKFVTEMQQRIKEIPEFKKSIVLGKKCRRICCMSIDQTVEAVRRDSGRINLTYNESITTGTNRREYRYVVDFDPQAGHITEMFTYSFKANKFIKISLNNLRDRARVLNHITDTFLSSTS